MRGLVAYFIKYDVAVKAFIIAFVLFGVIGMLGLKSSFFPLIDSKIINISVTYPGASPQEIEEGIMLKIEDNLKGLEGIDRVTSVSRENSGSLTVEILKGENIDFMLQEVKNAVDRVPTFPAGMEPLIVAKQENVRETIEFTVSGEGVSLSDLKRVARQVENDLRTMEGISQVELTGFPLEEIEIAINENSLLAYNLTFDEVAQSVSRTNLLITGGTVKTEDEEYLIRANNRGYYGRELENLVVRSDLSGRIVRLRDVAVVRDRFSESPDAITLDGNVAVNISVTNTNSEDLLSSAEKVKDYIETFNQKYNNIKLTIVSDRSVTLNQRTDLLLKNAISGILLVLFFLSLFLNVRLAFWVAFGLPISFLGMFALAGFFGVTINVLSLFGMIIVIGILVDDGIVIAENIYQHYERGKSPIKAALDGTLEVVPPIVSAILTTVLAFSTFFFLESRIGEFFSEVAIIVIVTLLVSLIEAIFILPAHLAHSKALVSAEKKSKHGFFHWMRWFNKFGDSIMNFLKDKLYSPTLYFCLKYKFLAFSIISALFIFTIAGFSARVIGFNIFPRIASDEITVTLNMPQGTNERITDSIISTVEKIAWEVGADYTEKQTGKIPIIENIMKRVGPGTSRATLSINLLPGESRDFSSPEITGTLRERVGPVSGVESLIFSSGGNFGGNPVSVSLLSNNIEELKAAKDELKAVFENNPDLKDINDNDPEGIKEIRIELLENAYALGLSLRTVMDQVRAAFFGFSAQRFQRGEDEVRVWVRYDRSNRESIADLDQMRIVTPSGNRVPFSEIATYEIIRGDVAINHLNGKREIQVSADVQDPNLSIPDIIGDIQQNIVPEIQEKYPSVSVSYEGQNREGNKLGRSLRNTFPIILIFIYITMVFTFRSFSQPLFLLLMIPLSLIGVGWGHWLMDFPINTLSLLGIIALIGVMVNDGLVFIGKFNGNLKEGMIFHDALMDAGRNRFRAIFLTSLTTIAGLAPLLLEKSRQAQFLKPMAISISFGIAIATVLTLLILPILLSVNNDLKVWWKWLRTGKKVTKEEVEQALIELKLEHDDLH